MFAIRNFVRVEGAKFRCFSRCCVKRQAAAEPLAMPTSDAQSVLLTPKIEKLVSDISQLTLVEVSELSTALKQRLNLPDAPVMAMSGPSVAQAQEEEDEGPKSVKTNFNVKLMKFDEKQKVALIKEIKNTLEGMNLVQAKKFVEGCPAVVKADVSKDEAAKLKEVLEKVGAEIVVD